MRILIVDDQKNILKSLKEAIGPAGHDCVSFCSSMQAFEYCKSHPIDLVITDFQIPGMNGLDLIRKIKKNQPKVTVFLVSGIINHDFEDQRLGYCDYFLTKPLDFALAIRMIDSLKRRKRRNYLNDGF